MTQTYSGKYRAWKRAKDYLAQNIKDSDSKLVFRRENFFKVTDSSKEVKNEHTSQCTHRTNPTCEFTTHNGN